jgi:hypothetical protein
VRRGSSSFSRHNANRRQLRRCLRWPGQALARCSRQLERAAIGAEENCAAGEGNADPGNDGADTGELNADDTVEQQEERG